jgi:hypothetical protein
MELTFHDCNEWNVHTFTSIDWRASLVPAAAVIPAPIAYIKVAAVEASVVEFPDENRKRLQRLVVFIESYTV